MVAKNGIRVRKKVKSVKKRTRGAATKSSISSKVMSKLQQLTLGSSRLDSGALKYLRLLSDPCNAPLTGPAYEGEGTGLFFRTKTIVSYANLVDSVVQFCPQYVTQNLAGIAVSTTGACQSPLLSNGSLATGGSFNNTTAAPIGPTLFGSDSGTAVSPGTFGSARCIAACVRVGYTGSIMNLSGKVYAKIGSNPVFTKPGANAQTFVNVMGDCPQVDDLRSRNHEYRWVPNFRDQDFLPLPGSSTLSGGAPTSAANPFAAGGQLLIVGVQGAPAGTITYEITCVWESQVTPGASAHLIANTIAPPTSNTLNHVLREIGNVGKWALSGKGQEEILGMFEGAGNLARTMKSGLASVMKAF